MLMHTTLPKRFSRIITHFLSSIRTATQRALVLLLSDAARPVRFLCIGAMAGLIQIGVLDLLTRHGWNEIVANITAFLLAAQINFLFSTLFTWHDRQPDATTKKPLLSRWLAFHVSITGSALLNMLVFIVASRFIPTLLASALGILCAAVLNFLVINQFVFREQPEQERITIRQR